MGPKILLIGIGVFLGGVAIFVTGNTMFHPEQIPCRGFSFGSPCYEEWGVIEGSVVVIGGCAALLGPVVAVIGLIMWLRGLVRR